MGRRWRWIAPSGVAVLMFIKGGRVRLSWDHFLSFLLFSPSLSVCVSLSVVGSDGQVTIALLLDGLSPFSGGGGGERGLGFSL